MTIDLFWTGFAIAFVVHITSVGSKALVSWLYTIRDVKPITRDIKDDD